MFTDCREPGKDFLLYLLLGKIPSATWYSCRVNCNVEADGMTKWERDCLHNSAICILGEAVRGINKSTPTGKYSRMSTLKASPFDSANISATCERVTIPNKTIILFLQVEKEQGSVYCSATGT